MALTNRKNYLDIWKTHLVLTYLELLLGLPDPFVHPGVRLVRRGGRGIVFAEKVARTVLQNKLYYEMQKFHRLNFPNLFHFGRRVSPRRRWLVLGREMVL